MNELKLRLIKEASQRHNKIFPCSHKEHLSDCFTWQDNLIFFWYNTEDQSTHVIIDEVNRVVESTC
ncbi:MAG: hypothetical protein GX556_05425 [Fibrobacter sp.]|nr:hypothetical protein [Fibrobacter sp.]